MKSMKVMLSFLLAVYLIFSTGCRRKASEEVDAGTFSGSEYRNNYFGMDITLPAGWSIQDMKSIQALKKRGELLVKDHDKNIKTATAASEFQTVQLFAAFKYPLGAPIPFNPNLICLAERVRHLPGIKSGKDYHLETRKILESGQLKVKFPEPVYSDTFGDIDFDVLYSETTLGNIVVKQNQYASVIKGYVLIFTATFVTDDQEVELDDILETLTFDGAPPPP